MYFTVNIIFDLLRSPKGHLTVIGKRFLSLVPFLCFLKRSKLIFENIFWIQEKISFVKMVQFLIIESFFNDLRILEFYEMCVIESEQDWRYFYIIFVRS